MNDVKRQLLRVKDDPRLSSGEKTLAQLLIDRIEELEKRDRCHWTELARIALKNEVQEQVIGKQAAAKINSFLIRHSLEDHRSSDH